MKSSINPRNYRKGLSKSEHKLSNYVVNGIKEILLNQTYLFLKEPQTLHEQIRFTNWILLFGKTFSDLKDYDWYNQLYDRIIKKTVLKDYEKNN